MNPLTLAMMMKAGQAPTPELIEQAKQLIQQAVVPPTPVQQPGQPPTPPPDPNALPAGAPLPGPGAPLPPGPPPPPIPVGEALPDATILPTISKRSGDNEGGVQ